MDVFVVAARALGSGAGQLALQVVDALMRRVAHALVLLEVGGGIAAAFFQPGKRGCRGPGCGLYFFALAAEIVDAQHRIGNPRVHGFALRC